MDRGPALALTLAVGAAISLQPVGNARLADRVGDLGAAFVSLALATVIVGTVLVAFGDPGHLRSGIGGFRAEHLLGPVTGAAIVTVSLIAVRPLGVGTLTAALVASQLFSAVLLDRAGVLGLTVVEVDWRRLVGCVLLLGGTVLVTLR